MTGSITERDAFPIPVEPDAYPHRFVMAGVNNYAYLGIVLSRARGSARDKLLAEHARRAAAELPRPRERGIPCVVGTVVGTRRIGSGMLVTVDGARGTVQVHGSR
jgi:hypothetical protein